MSASIVQQPHYRSVKSLSKIVKLLSKPCLSRIENCKHHHIENPSYFLHHISQRHLSHCLCRHLKGPKEHVFTARRFEGTFCKSKLSMTRGISSESSHSHDHNVQEISPRESSSRTLPQPEHVPVLVTETLQMLQPQDDQVLVDMTFGAGGHAKEILSLAPEITYIAADRDPYAHGIAQKMARHRSNIKPVLGKFSNLLHTLQSRGVGPGTVDAFLFDLGASSMQFDLAHRGFSLSQDGPLDMRMDGDRDPDALTAADVVNRLDPHDLSHILKKYGEERRAKEIAHAIVEARYAFGNFTRTKQLADIVQAVFNESHNTAMRHDKMYRQAHVATKTFQALRIFVNNELNELHNGLELARHFLRPGGRCVVISFHSLEDRVVKRHFHGIDLDEPANTSIHQHFRNASVTFDIDKIREDCLEKPWRPLSKKVQATSTEEMNQNPRARSAKLRGAIKL